MASNHIIYGFHGVEAFINNNPELIESIYADNERNDKRLQELIQISQQLGFKVATVDTNVLNKLAGQVKHQGIVAVLNSAPAGHQLTLKQLLTKTVGKDKSVIVVLDGITDPHNLGAIVRTCDCFGVDAIIIPKDNSASINATVTKTSAGAINYVPVITVNNLARTLDELKEADYWIAGTVLSDNSVDLFEFTPDKRIVWVLGSEDKGIRRLVAESCDHLVSIPMHGNTQSLNVSVAAGVILSYTNYVTKKS